MSPYRIEWVKFDGWKVEVCIVRDGNVDDEKIITVSADGFLLLAETMKKNREELERKQVEVGNE